MSERKYDVYELDALRQAVRNKYLYGSYTLPMGAGCSRPYREDEMARVVEEEVRTHMLAGHTADDLVAATNRPQTDLTNAEKRKPEKTNT